MRRAKKIAIVLSPYNHEPQFSQSRKVAILGFIE